jgi:murein DD-endopeptidase MepM/ murein hydrolase activator NlpD
MKMMIVLLTCFLTLSEHAIASPKRVIAGPDSTVYGIAYEHGIPTRSLIAANNLKPPYTLYQGQSLIIPSPGEHVVGAGETLQSIAEDHGVNVDVLAQENDAQALRPGQQLSLPSRDTTSMTEAFKQPEQGIQTSSLDPLPSVKSASAKGTPPPSTSPGVAGTALPHDLAAEIAREKGIDLPPAESTATPQADEASRPMLMGNLTQRNAGAPTARTSSAPPPGEDVVSLPEEDAIQKPKKEAKKPEKKKEKVTEKKEKAKAKEASAQKKEAQEQEAEEKVEEAQLQFIWPVEGAVGTKFKPGTSDGIKIKVAEGTPVKAAAAGKVVYAGNGLPKLGPLILLQHKGGWITAYTHNSSLLVKKGDKVKQGQVISKSGKEGNTPHLGFEMRKDKRLVDPLTHLGS